MLERSAVEFSSFIWQHWIFGVLSSIGIAITCGSNNIRYAVTTAKAQFWAKDTLASAVQHVSTLNCKLCLATCPQTTWPYLPEGSPQWISHGRLASVNSAAWKRSPIPSRPLTAHCWAHLIKDRRIEENRPRSLLLGRCWQQLNCISICIIRNGDFSYCSDAFSFPFPQLPSSLFLNFPTDLTESYSTWQYDLSGIQDTVQTNGVKVDSHHGCSFFKTVKFRKIENEKWIFRFWQFMNFIEKFWQLSHEYLFIDISTV